MTQRYRTNDRVWWYRDRGRWEIVSILDIDVDVILIQDITGDEHFVEPQQLGQRPINRR